VQQLATSDNRTSSLTLAAAERTNNIEHVQWSLTFRTDRFVNLITVTGYQLCESGSHNGHRYRFVCVVQCWLSRGVQYVPCRDTYPISVCFSHAICSRGESPGMCTERLQHCRLCSIAAFAASSSCISLGRLWISFKTCSEIFSGMGFEDSLVRQVMRRKIEQNGTGYQSAAALLEAVIEAQR